MSDQFASLGKPSFREVAQRRARLNELVRTPDHLFVPTANSQRLREAMRAALDAGDLGTADAAIADLEKLCRECGERHRAQVMSSRYPSVQAVIAAIECDGRPLGLDSGAIVCAGGVPPEAARLALVHFAEQARAVLAERERRVVLVPAPVARAAA